MTSETRLIALAEAIGTDVKDIYQKLETYTHTQAIPSASWTITHNLGKFPSVEVVDSSGSIVEGDITYNTNNQVTVVFIGGFSGVAYLN